MRCDNAENVDLDRHYLGLLGSDCANEKSTRELVDSRNDGGSACTASASYD